MKKSSRNSSLLSSVFKVFRGGSGQGAAEAASKTRSRSQEKYARQRDADLSFPYRAAEIVVEKRACNAVLGLAGTRFLMDEVPHIPVRGCDARKCSCIYLHHEDRRDNSGDRRAEFSALTQAYNTNLGNPERRGGRGRRVSDMTMR